MKRFTKKEVIVGLTAGALGYVAGKKGLHIDISVKKGRDKEKADKKSSGKDSAKDDELKYEVWFDSYKKAEAVYDEMVALAKEFGFVTSTEWREICFDSEDGNRPLSYLNKLNISGNYGWYLKDLNRNNIDICKKKFGEKQGWSLSLPAAKKF